MLPSDPLAIESTHIQDLISTGAAESRTLEFKRDLPDKDDRSKRDLCQDVSALANTHGGHLIYGIEERDGCASAVTGVSTDSVDDAIRRLEQTISSGVEPPIPGLNLRAVSVDDKTVIVASVPPSWRRPHLVDIKSGFRIMGRGSTGNYSLDASEVRNAFDLGRTLRTASEEWRLTRLASVEAGNTPVKTLGNGELIIHCIPTESVLGEPRITRESAKAMWNDLIPGRGGSAGDYINLDGLVVCGGVRQDHGRLEASSYTQVFESGQIEIVLSDLRSGDKNQYLPSALVEHAAFEHAALALSALTTLGLGYPIRVAMTLLGFDGTHIPMDHGDFHQPFILEKRLLDLGSIEVDSNPKSLTQSLRPVVDKIAHASGRLTSKFFTEDGTWRCDSLPLRKAW